jgi:hypothetical protein
VCDADPRRGDAELERLAPDALLNAAKALYRALCARQDSASRPERITMATESGPGAPLRARVRRETAGTVLRAGRPRVAMDDDDAPDAFELPPPPHLGRKFADQHDLSVAVMAVAVTTEPPAAERAALEGVFAAAGGTAWRTATNWMGNGSVCTWFGVTCGTANVVRLALPKHGLAGSLPASLAALSALATLDLSGNARLRGTLSPQFARWTALQTLGLYSTSISGTLDPSFAAWTSLGRLIVYKTLLSGTLDPAFAAWSQLFTLYFYQTAISGSLPAAFARMPMTYLYAHDSPLAGTLSPDFANWTALTLLSLRVTALSGTLDAGFAAWSQNQLLELRSSAVSGTLSPAFSAWTSLIILNLRTQPLSGTLDASFAAWTSLQQIALCKRRTRTHARDVEDVNDEEHSVHTMRRFHSPERHVERVLFRMEPAHPLRRVSDTAQWHAGPCICALDRHERLHHL